MKKNSGFTLVEVALVMIIMGILLAAASSLLLIYVNQVQIRTTQQRMGAIDEALNLFLNLNGRYPCPASLTAEPDTDEFGVEVSTNCGGLSGVVDGTREASGALNSYDVRIGAVPTRSLSLPDEYVADAWGRRFTFAITERLATTGTYGRNMGDVDIIDSNGNPVVNTARDVTLGLAHYVVVSHGKNASGGTPITGGTAFPCDPGDLDGENCDNDAVFRRTMLFSGGANAMDDLVGFRSTSAFGQMFPPGAVMAFNLHACPSGWVPYVGANGRVIVGTGTHDGVTYAFRDTGGEALRRPAIEELGLRYIEDVVVPMTSGGTTDLAVRGTRDEHENRMPYIALIYCEKT